MWEFSLFFPNELFNYFCQFETELKLICQNEKNCIRVVAGEPNVFAVAIPKKVYEQNILFIKEKIIQSILVFYKPKTIIHDIRDFSINDQNNKMLIDILTNFEIESDKKEIFSKLSLCSRLYLDSFVHFRLKSMLEAWKEMATLINQNSIFLIDDKVKIDLMRFLMNGISNKSSDVVLDYSNGNIKFVQNGKELSVIEKIFYAKDIYDNLLFTLISKSPKKITISNYQMFDANFVNSVFNLFGDSVKLIQ